jgi:adenylate cyclase
MLAGTRRGGVRGAIERAVAIADASGDDDDLRLRKRMGVAAGYLTIAAPLTLPILAQGHIAAVLIALPFSAYSLANLIVLGRSRRFERYVLALLVGGTIFVPTAAWFGGGITLAGSGVVWGFLMPAYALLALGPSRSRPWFGVFVGVVAAVVLLELAFGRPFGTDPFEAQLVSAVVNTLAPLTIVFGLLLYSDQRRRRAEERSEALLTNAIPASIARRLKQGEQRIADVYPATTVLFADLAGFTPWARATDPTRVAALLDGLFSRFDRVVAAAGIEKIKTIGDSYMAVAGAPEPREDHAPAAMAAARAMLDEAWAWRRAEKVPLDIRIGLASGPVAGGIIGDNRILFDLWGDTVNAAARMESTGEPGSIQIAASTRALLADDLPATRREVEVKGLGSMSTYLVGGAPRSPPYPSQSHGTAEAHRAREADREGVPGRG